MVTRLSFMEERRGGKSPVVSYMEATGLSVYEDAAGNLFGRRGRSDPDAHKVV